MGGMHEGEEQFSSLG